MSVYDSGRSVTLEMLDDELSALAEAGSYESEREVMRDALELFLNTNPTLRLEMAISLWQQGKVSLGRAVEIAQSDRESFKEELAARGVMVTVETDKEDIHRGEELIDWLRRDHDSV